MAKKTKTTKTSLKKELNSLKIGEVYRKDKTEIYRIGESEYYKVEGKDCKTYNKIEDILKEIKK